MENRCTTRWKRCANLQDREKTTAHENDITFNRETLQRLTFSKRKKAEAYSTVKHLITHTSPERRNKGKGCFSSQFAGERRREKLHRCWVTCRKNISQGGTKWKGKMWMHSEGKCLIILHFNRQPPDWPLFILALLTSTSEQSQTGNWKKFENEKWNFRHFSLLFSPNFLYSPEFFYSKNFSWKN